MPFRMQELLGITSPQLWAVFRFWFGTGGIFCMLSLIIPGSAPFRGSYFFGWVAGLLGILFMADVLALGGQQMIDGVPHTLLRYGTQITGTVAISLAIFVSKHISNSNPDHGIGGNRDE